MSTATTKQREARASINNERVLDDDVLSLMAGIDIRKMGTKFVIGYVYAITGFVAALDVATMLMMLTSITWLQYAIFFVAACALCIAVVQTAPYVADVVYDAGAYVCTQIGAGYAWFKSKKPNEKLAAARQRVSDLGKSLCTH
jgi:hypothetical protein